VVDLNRNLGEPQAVEVLCHEWAHALAWNYSLDRLARTPSIDPAEFDRASHDEAWGCAYSRVWRAYQEVIREGGVRPYVSARKSPLPSRTSVIAVLQHSQARQSPVPALPFVGVVGS